jgi:hypothetical protein
MRRIGVGERRARLGLRHRLAPEVRAAEVARVAESMVALHGTDPASVFLALFARMTDPRIPAIERALYEDRTVLRMLGMRRTMFVVPVGIAGVVHAACTRSIAVLERRKVVAMIETAGIANDGGRWLADVEASTLRALGARGQATAGDLVQDEPRLGVRIRLAIGKPYEGEVGVVTRVLFLLAADGRIVRGRPRGSLISSQYRWAPMDAWMPGGLPDLPTEDARTDLARRWLAAFGPAPPADLKWWAGWTAGDTTRALESVGAIEVALGGGSTGYVMPDDVEPVAAAEPWAALLPGLDPTPMGWAGRDWFLGEHRASLFDRSGNIGPTVWWDGRIVGGWAQLADGRIAMRLLEDIGREGNAAVEAEAARLTTWLGPVRITPRFRTPLERELTS